MTLIKTLEGSGKVGPIEGQFEPVTYEIRIYLRDGLKHLEGTIRLPPLHGVDLSSKPWVILQLEDGRPIRIVPVEPDGYGGIAFVNGEAAVPF